MFVIFFFDVYVVEGGDVNGIDEEIILCMVDVFVNFEWVWFIVLFLWVIYIDFVE